MTMSPHPSDRRRTAVVVITCLRWAPDWGTTARSVLDRPGGLHEPRARLPERAPGSLAGEIACFRGPPQNIEESEATQPSTGGVGVGGRFDRGGRWTLRPDHL